jgi:hypothetical protein
MQSENPRAIFKKIILNWLNAVACAGDILIYFEIANLRIYFENLAFYGKL